jgi:hypothetical protein
MKSNKAQKGKLSKQPNNQLAIRNQPNNKQVSAPVAQARVRVMNKPKLRPKPNGDIVISHREYINDIAGSVAFASTTFNINPGLAGVFPWLCAIAQRYESYKFESLKFCYETESATTATGSLILTVDYDASDVAPVGKTQAMSYRNAVRSAPWSDCCMTSLKEDLNKRQTFYVRAGDLAADEDIKLYDVGNLFVCTQAQANANLIGELYVEYVVKLMTPQMGDPTVGEAIYGRYSGTSNAAPLATYVSGNMPVSIVSSGTTTSSSTFTFTQPWQGYVSLTLGGTGITGVTCTTGTCSATEQGETINAGATAATYLALVDADIGETLIIVISNTTITAGNIYFGQADS